jgi:NAD(P)-dependent dehydrogenase (short-subunit alcohol dehydrogenase family)
MSANITGKVILIFGGAGGIGSAAARELASKGAKIAIADIDEERMVAVVDGIAGPIRSTHCVAQDGDCRRDHHDDGSDCFGAGDRLDHSEWFFTSSSTTRAIRGRRGHTHREAVRIHGESSSNLIHARWFAAVH